MLNSKKRVLAIACGVAVAMLAMPASSYAGLFDCLFGHCSLCAKPACAAPVAVAPACATCVPQTCGYMPTVVYRALYQPATPCNTCAAYQPAGCGTCASAYAMTTYRPAFGWISEPRRVVAYTTYQPVVPAVACGSCSPCSSCSTSVGYSPCSSCSGGCAAVSYGAPASSCATCQPAAPVVTAAPVMATPAAPVMVAPAVVAPAAPTTVVPNPYPGPSDLSAPQNAAPATGTPKTFDANKPSSGTEHLTPIPEQPGARFNSMPAPLLPNPGDRSASGAKYTTARVQLIAGPTARPVVADNGGWQPASE